MTAASVARVEVPLKVDVGLHRCGIHPDCLAPLDFIVCSSLRLHHLWTGQACSAMPATAISLDTRAEVKS